MNTHDEDCPRCRGGGCEWCHNTGKCQRNTVSVFVTGATGSGKSAICGEIEGALKAIGVDVMWENGDVEKRLTHADWQSALEQYNPKVVVRELNVASIPEGYFGGETLGRSKAP